MSRASTIDAYLFDLGNVVLRWRPEKLLRDILGDAPSVKRFIEETALPELILEQDRGLDAPGSEAWVAARAPHHLDSFRAYEARWVETLDGEIAETASLIRALRAAGRPVFALSNWASDHLALAEPHFPILRAFDDRVISAEHGLLKPDPAIYDLATARFGLEPARTLFIDDRAENVETAADLGFATHHFDPDAPQSLRAALPESDARHFPTPSAG
jgi:2-haloacid dehalogenase